MALNTVSSDRLSTNVKNTNFTAAEKQDLTDDILPLSGQLGNRNKLINGANLISQRGTSETGVSSTKYANAPDRWQFYAYPSGQSGTFTVSQDSTAPNGFQKSYKVDCTTADTSLQADSGVILRQTIEEQNLLDFRKGFSDAKQFSLSFYVKTSKTGTYVCELYDMRNTRHVSATYTVSDTNWNRYTITFPADTTGAFTSGSNNGGMIVHWWLVAGTNYTSGSLGTTWGNTAANRAVGQLNFADSTSNIFYLTGCQLEVGSVVTDFEHRSFGQELALCQRYFYKTYEQGYAPGTASQGADIIAKRNEDYSSGRTDHEFNAHFSVPMRATPTLTFYSYAGTVNKFTNASFDFTGASEGTVAGNVYYGRKRISHISLGDVVGAGKFCFFHFTASAEL